MFFRSRSVVIPAIGSTRYSPPTITPQDQLCQTQRSALMRLTAGPDMLKPLQFARLHAVYDALDAYV